MQFTALTLALVPAAVFAANNIPVTVGGTQLVFNPNTVTANVGDTVVFTIQGNHSVTEVPFANPCSTVLTGGKDSGFIAAASGSATFSITVPDMNPIWIKCNQQIPLNHCAAGMVFAINAPTTGNTFSSFQSAATGGGTASASSSAPTSCTTVSSSVGNGYFATTCNSASKAGSSLGVIALALGAIAPFLL